MADAKQAQSSAPKIPYGPDYSFTLSLEDNFDVDWAVKWMNDNMHVPFIVSIGVYLPLLYVLTKIMANREPLKLRGPLILWNFSLAVFSIVGFLRVFPEFYHTFKNFGFLHTVCINSFKDSKPSVYWIWLFVVSKIPELIDTVFLVLKKQRLIFLHVYHHASVVIFAWIIFAHEVAGARWYTTMNFAVHSVMYTYYALKAVPNFVRIPKWVSMMITTSQTLQMVAGTYVVTVAAMTHLSGKQRCDVTNSAAIAGLIIYISYLILFSHFFYKAYIAPAKSSDVKKRV